MKSIGGATAGPGLFRAGALRRLSPCDPGRLTIRRAFGRSNPRGAPMNPARVAFAAILATLVAAGPGCDETPEVGTPAQASTRSEGPPPGIETPAPDRPLVVLTPAALAKVKAAAEGLPGPWALRLEAYWPEGICSPQHRLQFVADPPSSEDEACESGGISIVVLKRQAEMLRGSEIHFGEKSGEEGFIITTPNFQGDALETWGPVLQADPLSAAAARPPASNPAG